MNTMVQKPTIYSLLPLMSEGGELTPGTTEAAERWDYIYEPDAKLLLNLTLTRYIESQVYQAVLENIACKQAAQMIAMKSATDNANDIMDRLKLAYHKARQAAITQELAEIGLGILVGIRVDKALVNRRIRPGESFDVQFTWRVLQLPQFRFIFKVDSPFNTIPESIETNNRFEHILNIGEDVLNQWWLDAINAKEAWETTRGSDDIVVAVIDTGVDQSHSEFEGNLWVVSADDVLEQRKGAVA